MAFRPDWGTRIYEARTAAGLSQAELSRLIDVGWIAVSRWERGVATPKDIYRIRMAKVFGVPANELFAYPDDADEEVA